MAIFIFLVSLLNMFSLYVQLSKADISSIFDFSSNPFFFIGMIALSCLMFIMMGSKRGFHQVSLYEDFSYVKKLYNQAIDKKVPVDSILNRQVYSNYVISLIALIIDSLLFPVFYVCGLTIIVFDSVLYANLFVIVMMGIIVSKIIRFFIDKNLMNWFDESMKWRRLIASQVED